MHEGKTNHRGIVETETRLRNTYYRPTLEKDVSDNINLCQICQTTKYDRNPPNQKLEMTSTTMKPFERVHIDIFQAKSVSFTKSFRNRNRQIPTNIYVHHGLPHLVIMDQGTDLKNSVVLEFFEDHNVKPHFITTGNSQSNGMIAIFHSTLIEDIRILRIKDKKNDILNQMPYEILGYNNSIHSVTKRKPVDIINGHLDTKDPLNIDINEKLINNQVKKHRDITEELYRNMNAKLLHEKEKTLDYHKNRKEPLTYGPNTNAYHKTITLNRNKLNPQKVKILQNEKIKVKTDDKDRHK